MTSRVLLVEDDPLQAEAIEQDLAQTFPGLEVTRIATESALRLQLDRIAAELPDLIILDLMLRWADPSADVPQPPEEVKREKHYRAGLRCERLLSEHPVLREVPIVLHTILEEEDMEGQRSRRANVTYVPKAKTTDPIVAQVEKILERQSLEEPPPALSR